MVRGTLHDVESWDDHADERLADLKEKAEAIEAKLEKAMKPVSGDLEAEGGVYADAFEKLLEAVKAV